jgi:hypothetical protein
MMSSRTTSILSLCALLLPLLPCAHAKTPLTDPELRGTATLATGASLTVPSGATLTVNAAANVNGLVRNPMTSGTFYIYDPASLYVMGMTRTMNLTVYDSASISGAMNVGGTVNFGGFTTFNGNTSFAGFEHTFQPGTTLFRKGTTLTTGTESFANTATLTLSDGSQTRAEPAAKLKGVARAARYAVFEIPVGIHNRPASTVYAEIASGNLMCIQGKAFAYGFNRTDGDSVFFDTDGSFVAPVTGYYYFSIGQTAADGQRMLALYRNYYPTSTSLQPVYALAANGDDVRNGASISWTGRLNAGARVVIGGYAATTTPNLPNTQFFVARLATQPAQEWTDFELKGSANNFEGLAEQALVYFYGSAYGSGVSTHGAIGNTKAVYYTDDHGKTNHGAARKWRKQNTGKSLFQQKSPYGTVGGVIVVVPVDATINPHNPNLLFVYQRVSATATEETWTPIMPKWCIVDPRPADQAVPADSLPPPPPHWVQE